MAHVVHHPLLGGHVPAQARQRLGEGAHVHVHLFLQSEMAGRAPAAFADGAEAVGVVHHDPGAVLSGQTHDIGQVRDVTAHGEHAVGDDQGSGGLGHLLQAPLQVRHVVVLVAEHLAEAEPGAVVDAGVVLPIQDHIVAPAHQGGDDPKIRLEARGEGHHRLLAEELGELRLQFQVHGQGAVQKPGAGAARAEFFESADARLHHLRAAGEAQVVVGAQHDPALSLHDDLRPLPGLQSPKVGVDALVSVFIRQRRGVALCKKVHGTASSICFKHLNDRTVYNQTRRLSNKTCPEDKNLSNENEVYPAKPLTNGGADGINSMISFSDCKLEV